MDKKVLIWLTDIRDEYVLRAEEAGKAKTDSAAETVCAGELSGNGQSEEKEDRMSGSYVVTPKSTPVTPMQQEKKKKHGGFWMYAGFGLAAAALLTAAGIGSLKWLHHNNGPLVTPMTLEEHSSEEGSETADEATEATTAEYPLEDGAYEVRMTGDAAGICSGISFTNGRFSYEGEMPDLVFYGKDKEQQYVLEDAMFGIVYKDDEIREFAEALIITDDIIVMTRDTDNTLLAGLYSPAQREWLIEPVYVYLEQIGYDLYTNAAPGDNKPGEWERQRPVQNTMYEDVRLLRSDGVVIASMQDCVYEREGSYIYDNLYLTTFDRSHIYDLNGNLLLEPEGYVQAVWGDQFLIRKEGPDAGCTVTDPQGNVLFRPEATWSYYDPGYSYADAEDYRNWLADGSVVVTDAQYQTVFDQQRYEAAVEAVRQKEEGAGFPTGNLTGVVSESPDKTQLLIGARTYDAYTDLTTEIYYLCDREFNISRLVFPDAAHFLCRDENTGTIWLYRRNMVDDKWVMELTKFWDGTVYENIELEALPEELQISEREADIIIRYRDQSGQSHVTGVSKNEK